MSYKAILTVDDVEMKLIQVHHSLEQNTEVSTGKPSSQVMLGRLSCEVQTNAENTEKLWQWGKESQSTKNGSIKFFKINEDASYLVIEFENAYCVHFSTHMNANSNSDMAVNLEITTQTLKFGNSQFDNDWAV